MQRLIFALLLIFSSATSASTPVSHPVANLFEAQFLLLPAYEVSMKSTQDKTGSARVGDSLELRVHGLPSTAVSLEPPMEAESGFYLNASDVKTSRVPEFILNFKVSILKPGKFTLPSLAIKDQAGQSIGRTRPYDVDVQSVIAADDPQSQEPAPAEPPMGLPFPWWVIPVGVVLLGGICALLTWFALRAYRHQKKVVAPVLVVEPEDVIALRSLAMLSKKQWIEKRQFKSYYFGISEILKVYFGQRYGFDALESTTGELIRALDQKHVLSAGMLGDLAQLFTALDRVKFTDFSPTADEPGWILERAQDWVHKTRRAPTETNIIGVDHAVS